MKASCVPILGILGHMIVNWDTKIRQFLAWQSMKTTWRAKLKCVHNVGAYECCMQTEFVGARSREQNFTDRKWEKSWRIWTDTSPSFLILIEMVCDFWAHYQPPFFWLCLFTSTWILFFLFYFFFLFLLMLFTFKLLYALYSKFERLKISGRTSVRVKSGLLGCGDSHQSGLPKLILLMR